MKRSEIFEEFVKVAQQQKIISNDSDKSFKALENNPRADSLDVSAIAALYGVKPETSPDMKYKNNIMEVAHKDPVVVSPAYDRLNGLVENNIERQNINLRIVNKNPDGLLTMRRYAEKELLLSLVRVANDLDNTNQHELMTLADACLDNLTNQDVLVKQAGKGKAALIAAIVGALGLGFYASLHSDKMKEGYVKDHEALVAELNDIINNTTFLGTGFELTDSAKLDLSNFKSQLDDLYYVYSKYQPIIFNSDKVSTYQNRKEKIESSSKRRKRIKQSVLDKLEKEKENINKAYAELHEKINEVKPEVQMMLNKFKNLDWQNRSIEQRGTLNRLVESIPGLRGGAGLIPNQFDDVTLATTAYLSSLDDILKILQEGQSKKVEEMRRLENAPEAASVRSMPDKPSLTEGRTPKDRMPRTGPIDLS